MDAVAGGVELWKFAGVFRREKSECWKNGLLAKNRSVASKEEKILSVTEKGIDHTTSQSYRPTHGLMLLIGVLRM